jgi:hypothetical protein
MTTLSIVATYAHGTSRFWVYEHMSDVGIFKFWVPHTKRVEGTDRYRSLQPPTTMDIHVEFRREQDSGGRDE